MNIHEKIWDQAYTQAYKKTRILDEVTSQIMKQVGGTIRYDVSDRLIDPIHREVWIKVGRLIKSKAWGYEIIHPDNP